MSLFTPPSSPRPSLDSSSSLVHRSDTSPPPPPPSSCRPSESLPQPVQHPIVSPSHEQHPKDSVLPDRDPTEAFPTPPSSTRPSLDLARGKVYAQQIRHFMSDAPDNHPTGRLQIKNVSEHEYFATGEEIGEGHEQFWYNRIAKSIIVKAPPSRMQDGCLRILHLIKNAINTVTQQGGFVCHAEDGPTGMLEIYDRADHAYIEGKEADGCLQTEITGVEQPRLPYLLMEVGHRELHEELVKDARAWLTDCDKEVLTVIVVNVSRRPGTPVSYNLGDWNGFAEVWERDRIGEDIHLAGSRVTFLPPLDTPATLHLRLDQTIPQHVLPDNLKDARLDIPLDSAVEQCRKALRWMKAHTRKRKRGVSPEGGGPRQARYS